MAEMMDLEFAPQNTRTPNPTRLHLQGGRQPLLRCTCCTN